MANFHRIDVNRTVWEVPERYQMLSTVGSGAYGQVWYVTFNTYSNQFFIIYFLYQPPYK